MSKFLTCAQMVARNGAEHSTMPGNYPLGRLLDELDALVIEAVARGVSQMKPLELRVLREWANGGTYVEIGKRVGLSSRAVETQMRRTTGRCGYKGTLLLRALIEIDSINAH
ncbi:MAG TPA: hypothetical protein VG757_01820 [Devosia sp.]|nr:hypothetical protein [Devosia sp.]